MEAGKKRALLARMEGQLAAMNRDVATEEQRWQRVHWALEALGELPLDDREQELFAALRHHVDALRHDMRHGVPMDVSRHRRTLIRTDCILWQMRLRRHPAAGDIAA